MSRPDYHDLAPGDFGSQLAPYDFVELKYDGLYAEFVGNADGWSIHGRNGRLIRYGEEPCPDCYLRGEMIIDTEWAEGSDLYGKFAIWDCVYIGDRMPVNFSEGFAMCGEAMEAIDGKRIGVNVVFPLAVDAAKRIWRGSVLKDGYEGLIFRSSCGQRYGRMKRVVTQDYVVTGVRRQGPRVTALYGGLWTAGRFLETVACVPIKSPVWQARLGKGNPDLIMGRVFEAAGNRVNASGALRHPRQAGKGGAVKWRTDKRGEECRA